MDRPASTVSAPAGPFVEVPYQLYTLWIGVPYADVVAHRGFPPAVVQRLFHPDQWSKHVTGWDSHAAYVAANGREACPDGRAWLDVGPDAKLRMHSGTWNAPAVVSGRGRGRWKW